MGAAIKRRREPLTADEHQRAWAALCHDDTLTDIAYTIETEAWGAIRMRPTQARPARMAGRIARLLYQKLGGEAIPERALLTADGIKVPDVAWCSDTVLAQHWSETALSKAPEICVEVVSPANAEAALRAKTALDLNLGALEVWLVALDGAVEIYTESGARADPTFGLEPAAELAGVIPLPGAVGAR